MADSSSADKSKIFVSYSRKDRDFVDRLTAALEAQEHIEVFRDTDDILPTEEWKQRLELLIGEADTIVFCVSPDSTTSDVCRWEAEVAEGLNKRIAPIVIRDGADIPSALAKRNYIFFTKPEEFERSLSYLITALDADIAWIREHTRLGELSRRWERSGQPKDQLLRGADLDAAETWLTRRPRNAPSPTETTVSYLGASRKEAIAQARRTRRARAGFAGLCILLSASLAAWRYEQLLKDQIYWFTSVRGYVHTPAMARALKTKQPFKDCAQCPEMIVVPPGTFLMGSSQLELNKDRLDNMGPQRKVSIGYWLAVSRFEATFDEWDACAAHGDCDGKITSPFGRGRLPVFNVSWDDAKRYVEWLARITRQPYRLLSEAEWEYAARAGSTTEYPWGNEVGKGNAVCEICGTPWDKKQPAPVGSLAPNAFGLHDMHGNVFEWVEDCAGNYDQAPSDGSPLKSSDCTLRIVRGGSWIRGAAEMRSSHRIRAAIELRNLNIGFRVARTLGP
jgi:formylglycine-generating enzyme required for sulfatase activity